MTLPESLCTKFTPTMFAEIACEPKRYYEVVVHFYSAQGRAAVGRGITRRAWFTRDALAAVLATGYRVTVLQETNEAPQ